MRLFSVLSRKSGRRSPETGRWISAQTKKAIAGILLILLSVISILSFFSLAGPTGNSLLGALRLSFGWVAYFLPLLFLAVGIECIWRGATRLSRWNWVGVVLMIVG